MILWVNFILLGPAVALKNVFSSDEVGWVNVILRVIMASRPHK